nr:tail-anchored protein insertion receptor WRB isoform X1 [Columba livia]
MPPGLMLSVSVEASGTELWTNKLCDCHINSHISRLLQKDAEQESEMRAEIQNMKQELSTISMMDEFARYARLERKINKMTDKLKTHVKARTAQLAKIKWVINIVFYILQAALMISLIWKYYSEPVTVLPSKWLAPLERLVAFPTGVAVCSELWDSSEGVVEVLILHREIPLLTTQRHLKPAQCTA